MTLRLPLSSLMSEAPYLPAQCDACEIVYLAKMGSLPAMTCRACGGSASVLPGEAYGERDVELFERVEAATRSAVISRRKAERLVVELTGITTRSEPPDTVLLRVIDLVPPLYFLVPALHLLKPPQRFPLLRASGMLLTIFTARLRRLQRQQAS